MTLLKPIRTLFKGENALLRKAPIFDCSYVLALVSALSIVGRLRPLLLGLSRVGFLYRGLGGLLRVS